MKKLPLLLAGVLLLPLVASAAADPSLDQEEIQASLERAKKFLSDMKEKDARCLVNPGASECYIPDRHYHDGNSWWHDEHPGDEKKHHHHKGGPARHTHHGHE